MHSFHTFLALDFMVSQIEPFSFLDIVCMAMDIAKGMIVCNFRTETNLYKHVFLVALA
jgi:hypothetical protein